jgi:hypothetical protein
MGCQREEEVLSIGPALSRRGFFGAVGVLGAITVAGPAAASLLPPAPLVSFHRDAPYLDPTGTAPLYRPRIATDWGSDLDEEALLRLGVVL